MQPWDKACPVEHLTPWAARAPCTLWFPGMTEEQMYNFNILTTMNFDLHNLYYTTCYVQCRLIGILRIKCKNIYLRDQLCLFDNLGHWWKNDIWFDVKVRFEACFTNNKGLNNQVSTVFIFEHLLLTLYVSFSCDELKYLGGWNTKYSPEQPTRPA